MENVRHFSLKDVQRAYRLFSSQPLIQIAVAGDVDPNWVAQQVQKNFKDRSRKNSISIPNSQISQNLKPLLNHRLALLDLNSNEIRVFTGIKTVGENNRDYYSALVLEKILGGLPTSDLIRTIRTTYGYSYHVESSFVAGKNESSLIAYADTSSGDVPQVIELMHQAFKRVFEGELSNEEIEMAKNSLISSYVVGGKRGQAINENVLWAHRINPLGNPNLYIDEIRRVSKDSIRNLIQTTLSRNELVTVVVGKGAILNPILNKHGYNVVLFKSIDEVWKFNK